MLVGLNLASSLKGYAQMMRWRFLASEYRTLQDFELVMQCESQAKVFRLIWAGRTRGRFWPNGVQVLAFLWILINIALQVVTALLGLTYSIDISDNYIHWKAHANVSISYMHAIEPYLPADSIGDFDAQSKYAQSLGSTGSSYPTYVSTLDNDLFGGTEEYYQNEEGTLFWYRFIDHNPTDWDADVISDRTITTNATCKKYKVTLGGYAGFDDSPSDGWVSYTDDSGNTQSISVPDAVTATDATTWMAQNVTTCGARCATLWALQSAGNDTYVPHPQLWQCNNTVSHVNGWQTYGSAHDYDLPDDQARIFGGALGWTGINTTGSNRLQYQVYEYPQFPAPSADSDEPLHVANRDVVYSWRHRCLRLGWCAYQRDGYLPTGQGAGSGCAVELGSDDPCSHTRYSRIAIAVYCTLGQSCCDQGHELSVNGEAVEADCGQAGT